MTCCHSRALFASVFISFDLHQNQNPNRIWAVYSRGGPPKHEEGHRERTSQADVMTPSCLKGTIWDAAGWASKGPFLGNGWMEAFPPTSTSQPLVDTPFHFWTVLCMDQNVCGQRSLRTIADTWRKETTSMIGRVIAGMGALTGHFWEALSFQDTIGGNLWASKFTDSDKCSTHPQTPWKWPGLCSPPRGKMSPGWEICRQLSWGFWGKEAK